MRILLQSIYTVVIFLLLGGDANARAPLPAITSFTVTSLTNVSCNGGADGAATVTATGGAGGYTYSWSPSGGAAATATGLSAGTYTCVVTDAASATATVTATITQPAALTVTGTNTLCATTTLSASMSGGTWSSSNAAIATVGSTGVVTGVAAGTAVISYVHSCATATRGVTVNLANPGTITGLQTMCATTFIAHGTTGTAGGTWVSSNTAVGTINSSTGTMGGVLGSSPASTTTVSYTVTNSCGSMTATVNNTVYKLSDTGAVTGPSSVCVGNTVTFTSTSTTATSGVGPFGYTWSSSAAAVGSINSSTGIVTGLTVGTTRITYTASGCGNFRQFRTLNVLPASVPATTGTNTVTAGSTTTLSNTVSGGTWSSTNAAVGTVGSTGIVSGISAGTTTISYLVSNSCGTFVATTNVTVFGPLAASVTAQTNVSCNGGSDGSATITAAGGTTPYTYSWAPSGGTAATASGLTAGIYTCTVTDGVSATTTVTATITEPAALAITGTNTLCATTTLTASMSGGTWSSSNAAVATVGSTGIVTGVAAGTAVISYVHSCATATQGVTVNLANPGTITGLQTLCATTFIAHGTTGTAGGTWVSSNTAVGTIGTTGTLGGVSSGTPAATTTISYTVTNGCGSMTATIVNTVYALSDPGVITGPSSVCEGSTATFTSSSTTSAYGAPFSGTWSSSATAVGTIGSTAGIATGITAGTTRISYTVRGCGTFRTFHTLNVLPASVPATTGTNTVTAGSTTTLSNTVSGGTWSSTNTAVGTVSTGGVVTGITSGTTIISYLISNSCGTYVATTNVTVFGSLAATVTAQTNVSCNGGSDGSATVTASGGTTPYTYSWAPSGGTGATASGLSAGTYTCTVTDGVSLTATTTATITEPAALAITGVNTLCATTTLTASMSGGTWSSSNAAVATVGSTGIVTGVAAGTAVISYVHSCGTATQGVTVNLANPGTITGLQTVCATAFIGHGTTGTAGGTWVSSNTAVGTINSSTGTMGGVLGSIPSGTTTISYTVTNGCGSMTATIVNTVYALSDTGTVTGPASICVGSTGTFTSTSATSGTGGPFNSAWSSSATAVGTIGAATGIAMGVATGTTRITYTVTGCGTFRAFRTLNVLPASVPAVTGTNTVTVGATTTLSNTVSGGIWSSTNTAVGTVGSTTGIVTGVSAGTTTISYLVSNSCGTFAATVAVTVSSGNTAPTFTGGSPQTLTVCQNASAVAINSLLQVNDADTAQTLTWTATSGPSHGTLSLSGTTTITGGTVTPTGKTYTPASGYSGTDAFTIQVSDGAGGTATTTINVTINPVPTITIASYTPNPTLPGLPVNFTVSDATLASYSWNFGDATTSTTMNPSKAYASGGTFIPTLTATNSYGCPATDTAEVTVLPSAGSLMGYNPPLCTADVPDTLRSIISGGTWSSSNTGAAIIGSTSGILTAVAPGVATITYHLGGGYIQTLTVLAGNSPNPIFGPATTCMGSNTGLNVLPYGSAGAWTSSTTGVATIGTGTGICAAVSLGTTTITWTLPSGCYVTRTQTVAPTPAAITGPSFLCVADTVTYLNDTVGGTWSSSNSGVVSVNATSGLATGMAAGTATLSYTIAYGCAATKLVNGGGLPAAITGGLLLCPSGTSTLSCATAGGAWSTGDVAVATVTGGVVTGVSAGTANITYTLTSGCRRVVTVTVNAAPGASTGTASLCVGGSTTLSNAATGGTWSSSSTATATVGSASGVVTGIAAGNANITYTVAGAGCYTITVVTVNAASGAITGTLNACVGDTSVLSHSTTGGTWLSSNTALATVDAASGAVAGVAAGTATITYFVSASCYVTTSFTVKALPTAISGTASVCVGSTSTLASGPTGGTWSSSASGTAPVNASTGLVSGYAAGTATISYSISNGCRRTQVVTVNAAPTAILGATGVCVGGTTTLTDTTTGGTWSSSNTAVATIDGTTGVVSGIATGTSLISYTLGTGCRTTRVLSVVAVPAAITGTATLCAGSVTTLSSTTGGGTWSSSDITAATTGTATGTSTTVSGVSAGNATISYTVAGCATTTVVTVNASPGTISGLNPICIGNSAAYSIGSTGGTWVSSASYVTIGSATGIATGIAAGTATISYRVNATCYSTLPVTVTATPAAITGTARVCIGSTTILGHPVSGGSWSGSSSAASVTDSAGFGVVSGSIAGTATITYTLPSGCYKTVVVTVNSNPATPTGGTSPVCAGATTTLAATPAGGTWSSSNTAVGTVGATTGVVMGVSSGTATITYRITATSCYATKEVSVNPLPGPITGSTSVCVGASTTLTDTAAGGIWTMTPATVATIGGSTGLVNGVVAGAATVTYTLPTGCRRTGSITVQAAPAAITGNLSICVGNTTTLASSPAALTWSSSDVTTATVSTAGVVTGAAAGNATISYTNAAGCSRTAVVTVNTALPANTSSTGSFSVCSGTTITLSNSVSGGTWNSSSSAIAVVGSSTGVVTGSATGAANITYSLGTGCRSISTVSVNAAAPAITGTTSVCAGSSVTFTATGTGSWSSADAGIATVAGGVVTGVAAGSTIITYTTASGCSSVKSILVKVVPVIGAPSIMTAGDTLTATSTVSGGTWSSSSAAIAGVTSTTGLITAMSPGSVTISFTASSTGCAGIWGIYVIIAPAGRSATNAATANMFSIYPNPTNGTLTISTSVAGELSIYTIDGKVTGQYSMTAGANSVQLSSDLAAGVYMCQFTGTDGSTQQARLILQH